MCIMYFISLSLTLFFFSFSISLSLLFLFPTHSHTHSLSMYFSTSLLTSVFYLPFLLSFCIFLVCLSVYLSICLVVSKHSIACLKIKRSNLALFGHFDLQQRKGHQIHCMKCYDYYLINSLQILSALFK